MTPQQYVHVWVTASTFNKTQTLVIAASHAAARTQQHRNQRRMQQEVTRHELTTYTTYTVCRRYVPRYCSLGSDVTYHSA